MDAGWSYFIIKGFFSFLSGGGLKDKCQFFVIGKWKQEKTHSNLWQSLTANISSRKHYFWGLSSVKGWKKVNVARAGEIFPSDILSEGGYFSINFKNSRKYFYHRKSHRHTSCICSEMTLGNGTHFIPITRATDPVDITILCQRMRTVWTQARRFDQII